MPSSIARRGQHHKLDLARILDTTDGDQEPPRDVGSQVHGI